MERCTGQGLRLAPQVRFCSMPLTPAQWRMKRCTGQGLRFASQVRFCFMPPGQGLRFAPQVRCCSSLPLRRVRPEKVCWTKRLIIHRHPLIQQRAVPVFEFPLYGPNFLDCVFGRTADSLRIYVP